MNTLELVTWCLSTCLLAVLMTSHAAGQSQVVVCYYASWAHYRQGVAKYRVEDIPIHLCTHLVYAFAVLDSNTSLAKSHDTWLDINLKNFQKFTQLKKKNPGMKVLLGLGGWNDSRSTKYSRLVADPALRRTFTDHILDLLLQYEFDGLDLDWEYPGYEEGKPSDKQGFTAWLEDLRAALNPRGLLLTSAVSAGREIVDRGYDVPKVAQLLDLIFLMSYDFHGSWESKVAHHAPLYPEPGQDSELCVDFAVNYWIQKGAPASKLVVGVPLYGRSWTLASNINNSPGASAVGPGRPGPHVKASGNMAFFECCLAFLKEGWSKVTGVGGPYLTKGNQWVGYDDVEAVTAKAQYAKDEGLAGVMVWDLPSDDFGDLCGYGSNPLLTAIYNTINGTSTPSDTTESSTSPGSPPPDGDQVEDNLVEREKNGDLSDKQKKEGDREYRKQGKWPTNGGQVAGVGDQSTNSIPATLTNGVGGNDVNRTSNLLYPWLAWPIFSQPQSSSRKQDLSQKTSQTIKPAKPVVSQPAKPVVSQAGQASGGDKEKTTSNLLYPWLSWPIFSQAQQSTPKQDSPVQPSQTLKPRQPATPAISQPSQPTKPAVSQPGQPTKPAVSKPGQPTGGSKVNTTSNLLYPWLAWPIFNQPQSASRRQDSLRKLSQPSRTAISQPQQPSKPFVSQPPPVSQPFQTENSIKPRQAFASKPSQAIRSPRPFITKPAVQRAKPGVGGAKGARIKPPTSPRWYASCASLGFAPDPSSCNHFYRCTNGIAYRFDCPGGLRWHQAETSCDWPHAAPCPSP